MNKVSDACVHIALAADHRYACGLKATFISMVNACRSPKMLEFHIFDVGLTKADREELDLLGKRFGYLSPIDYIVPDMTRIEDKFEVFHNSYVPMLRLMFPEILPQLDWVLWADVDTLWFRDPKDLWDLRDERVSLLWAQDIPSTRKWAKKIAKWRPNRNEDEYACSGVALMNLKKMRNDKFVQKCMDFVEKWGVPLFPDQDIMNEVCYGDSIFVDRAWDCMYPIDDIQHGLVLHFNCIGQLFDKGRFERFFPLFEIWFRYYAEVVEGKGKTQVAVWWKRALYNLIAVLYPFRKLIAAITGKIHPWVSDFIQRLIFFSWLRRKRLWA